MKKFLSLVLALVMTMSLVTISAGAKDFTDSDEVNYPAAIDVMSELKVIDGYTDGSFRPTVELNRGAAAKIICNMILSPTTASALSASSAPFSDVPADSVFAGYITYCAKEGIINGYTDGTFRPTAPLTGYAFMKMLLGALGYDADIEGYTGANWSVNVAKQAIGIGLDDGNDNFVGTKYVTREEACLYALNTLSATMVEYDAKTTVTVNGAQVVVGGSKANEVSQSGYKDTMNASFLQFAEKYFTNLKTIDADDDFYRPASEWKIKNKSVGVYADDADATYTEEVKGKVIYADLGSDSDDHTWNVYVNGEKSGTTDGIYKKSDDKFGGQGVLTQLYMDVDNADYRMVQVYTYIMEVADEYDEDEEELELVDIDDSDKMDAPVSPDGAYTLGSDEFEGLDAFEEGDYVLVTVANGKVMSIEKVEPVVAVLDEHVEDESMTADGVEYKFSAAYADIAKYMDPEVDEEYNIYLDTYGNVIYVDGVEAEDQYVYISEVAASSLMSSKSKMKAYAYFTDGSEEEITIKKIDRDKVYGNDEADYGVWYKYEENSDGTYNLTTVDEQVGGDYEGAVTVEDSVVITVGEGEEVRGTKSTVFVVVDDGDDVSVYTGIKKAPIMTTANDAEDEDSDDARVKVVVDENNYAEYVFVDLGDKGEMDGTEDSEDVIFILDATVYKGTDSADNDYYRYKAIVNGEETKVRAEAGDWAQGVLFGEIEYDSETGYISDMTEVDETSDPDDYIYIASASSATQKSGVITIDGEKIYMADDATIYAIEDGDDVSTVSAKKLVSMIEDADSITVYGVLNSDAECTALYVVF